MESLEREAAALFARPDVAEFVSAVNHSISEKTVVLAQPSRKVQFSDGAVFLRQTSVTLVLQNFMTIVLSIRCACLRARC